MQDFDFNTEIPLGRNRDLLSEQKQSGIGDFLPRSAVRVIDNLEAKTGIKLLGR
jgi:hypothetical protein